MALVEVGLPVPIPEELAKAQPELISQGAEALVFVLPSKQIAKYRPPKPWRLPELDRQLRKRRTTQESRVLQRLEGLGIGVPHLGSVHVGLGLMYMEFVEGLSLKQATWDAQQPDGSLVPQVQSLYEQLGSAIAHMHNARIVHGDLTTSNAMVSDGKIVLIDFGLSSQAASIEEEAVDLYVLERAIQSTHPREATELVRVLMQAYTATSKQLGAPINDVLARLEKVRQRGRKRTQLG